MDIAYVDEVTGGYSFAKFFKEAELLLPETDKKTAIVSMDIDGLNISTICLAMEKAMTFCVIFGRK